MDLFATLNERPDDATDEIPSSLGQDVTIHTVGDTSLVGVAVRDGSGPAIYIPIGHIGGGNRDAAVVNRFLMNNLRGRRITSWNCKSVSNLFYEFGIDTAQLGVTWNEVQFKAALIDSRRKKTDLRSTCEHFGVPYDPLPNRVDAPEFIQLTHANNVAPHARQDVATVQSLDQKLEVPTECEPALDLENEVIPITIAMQRRGVPIDEELLERYLKETDEYISKQQSAFNRTCGHQCDVNDVRDLQALFRSKGQLLPGGAKPGSLSFARRCIQEITDPTVQAILDLRAAQNIRTKYLLPYKASLRSGKVYPDHSQLKGDWSKTGSSLSLLMGMERTKGMVSGLYSLSNPPITQAMNPEKQRELYGHDWIIRRLFVPESGQFLSADASQIEMRIFAHQTGDRLFINALEKGLDPHVWIGKQCRLTRTKAKLSNYICLYGGGEDKLAESLNVSLEEASDVLAKYHAGFSLSRISAKRWQKTARREGHVQTQMGRRRHYASGDRIYTALNAFIQMTRADIMKMKLWALHPLEDVIGFKIRFVASDEICGDLLDPAGATQFKEAMDCQELEMKPTTRWTVKSGPNWCDLQPLAT